MKRRDFLRVGTATALCAFQNHALGDEPQKKPSRDVDALLDRICLFTDPVDDSGYSYAEVAGLIRQLKIAGPDLTVRPGGLVPPDRVTEELPKAAAAFREQGLTIPMLSTGILSPDDSVAQATLTAMGKLGIRYYKLGYYHYDDPSKWQQQIEATRKDLTGLIKLGQTAGVEAGVHNHAGATVGGAMWDLAELLEQLDPNWVGSYFDVAHATIEGGEHAWKLGFHRLSSHFKMLAIKDFTREKVNGRWKVRWCPLGEGAVRWEEFCKMLAATSFEGPISLHIEYDPGGNDRSSRLERCFEAAERDLKFFREKIREAFS